MRMNYSCNNWLKGNGPRMNSTTYSQKQNDFGSFQLRAVNDEENISTGDISSVNQNHKPIAKDSFSTVTSTAYGELTQN